MSNDKFSIVIIASEDRGDFIPIVCPECSFLMKTSDDAESYQEFNCCFDCKMKWAERRRKDWMLGWRPTKNEINDEIRKRKKIPPAFHL